MKKLFIFFALIGISAFGYSQDVKVNINNQDVTAKDDCPYRINGICVTEDIGGVDTEFIQEYSPDNSYWPDHTNFRLINYNSFAVSVVWKVKYKLDKMEEEKSGNIVLGVDGLKEIRLEGLAKGWQIEGLIVRKLVQQ